MTGNILSVIYAILGTLAFGIIFNVRKLKLISGALLGGFIQALFVVFDYFLDSTFLTYFFAAFIGAMIGEILAVLLKCPATIFIIISIFPLVPGSRLYKTMTYALSRDRGAFILEGIDTLKISFSIAFGILIVLVTVRSYRHIRANIQKNREKLKKGQLKSKQV